MLDLTSEIKSFKSAKSKAPLWPWIKAGLTREGTRGPSPSMTNWLGGAWLPLPKANGWHIEPPTQSRNKMMMPSRFILNDLGLKCKERPIYAFPLLSFSRSKTLPCLASFGYFPRRIFLVNNWILFFHTCFCAPLWETRELYSIH